MKIYKRDLFIWKDPQKRRITSSMIILTILPMIFPIILPDFTKRPAKETYSE